MKDSIARALLAAHATGGAPEPDGRWRLRPDHVVLGESASRLALAALERTHARRIAVEVGLVCADRRPLHAGFEQADVLTHLQHAALARGFHFAPPGSGPAGEVYAEHFATPGRLAFASGAGLARAAAFGTLVLDVDVLEAVATLAHGVLAVEIAGVRLIRVTGRRVAGVGGEDVALALRMRVAPGALAAHVLEFTGDGFGTLGMAERWRLASVARRLGARAALLPSDERTREHLRALGREADWRTLASADDGADVPPADTIELDAVEPQVAPRALPRSPRRVLDLAGAQIAAIRLGGEASDEDLERFCECAGEAALEPGVRVSWEPASRAAMTRAEQSGLLAALTGLGIALRTEGAWVPPPAGSGLTLCFGVPPEPGEPRDDDAYDASLETCAVAALAGALRDPRERFAVIAPARERLATPSGSSRVLAPARADERAAPIAAAPFPDATPLLRPLRGPVLIRRDRLPVAAVLAWGARRFPEEGDVGALARHLFTDVEPAFPERAAAHGGGFVVAGEDFGGGEGEGERAALALAVAGVRATFARSYAPDWRARLVRAGVLPLRLDAAADFAALVPGDELELPGLPHALEEGRSLAVRNLTRGTQLLAHHDLDEHDLAIVGAGGLLAAAERVA